MSATMMTPAETTATVMHGTPRLSAVLWRQLRSVRHALRPETLAFLAGLVLFAALGIYSAIQTSHSPGSHYTSDFSSKQSAPYGFFALFIPFAVWKSDNPSRRAYHLAMPVAQGPHTMMKLLAGWVWAMAGAACYLLFLLAMAPTTGSITGTVVHFPALAESWSYLTPFTAATVMYLLGSMMAISVDHPWRWALVVFVVVPMLVPMMGGFQETPVKVVLEAIFLGRYGLITSALGFVPAEGDGMQRWLIGTVLWVSLGLGASMAAAWWRRDV